MIEKIRSLVLKLESESNIYNKFILSELIANYYSYLLSDKDKKILEKELENIILYNSKDSYDTLYHDVNTHIEISDRILSTYYEIDFDNYLYYPKKKLNKKEANEIISEILSDIGDDIYKLYKNLENTKKIIVKPFEREAICINGFGIEQDSIIINKNIDMMVEFIITKNHEIGHSYEHNLLKNLSKKEQIDRYKYNYTEVVSKFFERVSIDYMINNHIYKYDTQALLFSRYVDLLCDFYSLDKIIYYIQNDMCKYDKESYYFTKDMDYEEIEDRFIFEIFYKGNYRDFIDYGYGFLLGEYFFSLYRQDKKEGLKSLKEFILKQGCLNNEEILKEINFYNNDLSFLKNGINDNLSYLRNRHM